VGCFAVPISRKQPELHSTLQRVAAANARIVAGEGMQPDAYIPIAEYHSRLVANQLTMQLTEHGVRVKSKKGRLSTTILVAFEDRATAYPIRDEFDGQHEDSQLNKYTRDYDLVMLVALFTLGIASFSFFIPIPNARAWTPLVILASGASICISLECWHRARRNAEQSGRMRFTILDWLLLCVLCATNLALWRIAF
jgi:hypothetical protein